MKKSVKKKPENLPSNGNIDFDKEFEYFYDICLVSKQKIYIGKFILEHRFIWFFSICYRPFCRI